MRLLRYSVGAATAAAVVSLCAAPASAAAADEMVLQGAGTYSPGLGVAPAPQSVNFGATATVIGTHGLAASYGCAFAGDDLNGDLAEGAGILSGGCGPISLPLCIFVRVGTVLPVVTLACATNGSQKSAAAGEFVFSYNQTPPSVVTSYNLAGDLVYGQVP